MDDNGIYPHHVRAKQQQAISGWHRSPIPMENKTFIHPAFDGITAGLDLLAEGAEALASAVRQKYARRKSKRPGQVLRAGNDTPLWNSLVAALAAECKKHGDQARLAKMVGLSRQRMNNFLRGIGGLPDAERTLTLLIWLANQRRAAASAPAKVKRAS